MSEHDFSGRLLLSEPVPIFETFCDDIAEVSDLGSVVRVTCSVVRPVSGTAAQERAVVSRLVLTPEAARSLSDALAAAIVGRPEQAIETAED